jgi:Uma2 family endonuclease
MTSAPAVKIDLMPMEEFIRRSEQEGPFELIDGEIVPKMPNVAGHSVTSKRLFRALTPLEDRGAGEVFYESTFVLTDDPRWVRGSRIPDLMFLLKPTLEAYRAAVTDWLDKPFILIPDIVIEVVSPTDTYTDMHQRALRYLDDGVRLVWIVDPEAKTVTVHRQGSNQQTLLVGGDTLTADDLLPGFALALADLFA